MRTPTAPRPGARSVACAAVLATLLSGVASAQSIYPDSATTGPRTVPAPETPAMRVERMKIYKGMWVGALAGKIKRHWKPPHDQHGQVSLHLEVLSSGEVEAASIARSSGKPDLDRLLLEAVKSATPLPKPLELEAYEKSLTVVFSTDD